MSNLYNVLINKEFLNDKLFADDYDTLADLRDKQEFDSTWSEVYYELEKIKSQTDIDESIKNGIEQIREESFRMVYKLTENDDLAAFVSDDFELISYAVILDFNNSWLSGLAKCYADNIFPAGIISESDKTLKEILLLSEQSYTA